MLKQLIRNRRSSQYQNALFQQHIYEMKNSVEVLGFEANTMSIDNEGIAAGYVVDDRLFFKSMQSGYATVTVKNGDQEALVQLFVRSSGEISVEVTPFLGNLEIVPVYFRAILADTAIAIDLKGAFKRYLVTHDLMEDEDVVLEVHYESMHPNVLKDSYFGNFILGYHKNGDPISNTEEYGLAGRVATLSFSKVVIQQGGSNVTIDFRRLLTFVITDCIFVSGEDVSTRLSKRASTFCECKIKRLN